MRRLRWTGWVLAGVTMTLLVTGCGELPSDDTKPVGTENSAETESGSGPSGLAEDAGGICELLDFAALSAATGEPFSVAVSGGEGEVTSCVVQTTAGSFPDITLTKAKTATDTETYRSEIPPEQSKKVKDLGKAGYSALRKQVPGGGPVVEIGWLTDGHMYSFRYTTVEGTEKDAARATIEALVEVVRGINERAAAAKDDKDD